MSMQFFVGATAVNGPPAATTDGLSAGLVRYANQLLFMASNPSEAGADSITLRLWGHNPNNDGNLNWYPVGVAASGGATNLTKGTLNGGLAITVNGSPQSRADHAELVEGLRSYTELYVEIVAITGTWDCVAYHRDPGNQGDGERF